MKRVDSILIGRPVLGKSIGHGPQTGQPGDSLRSGPRQHVAGASAHVSYMDIACVRRHTLPSWPGSSPTSLSDFKIPLAKHNTYTAIRTR